MKSSQTEFNTSTEVSGRQQDREDEIVEHLPLVKKLAMQIYRKLPQGRTELDDLISAGMFGLLDALNRYDPSHENSFDAFAYSRIRGAILDSLREDDRGSRNLREKGKSIEKAIQRLAILFGREPTEAESADFLDMTIAQYQSAVCELWSVGLVSLDSSKGCSEQSSDIPLNRIPDSSSITPLAFLEKKETTAGLGRAIASLPEREKRVVSLYYFREMTLKEIGTDLGVMESCVSKIHAKAVLKLRAAMMDGSTPVSAGGGCAKRFLMKRAERNAQKSAKAEHQVLRPIAAMQIAKAR